MIAVPHHICQGPASVHRRLCLHPRREIGEIFYSRSLTPANGTAKILIRRGLCPTTHTR